MRTLGYVSIVIKGLKYLTIPLVTDSIPILKPASRILLETTHMRGEVVQTSMNMLLTF